MNYQTTKPDEMAFLNPDTNPPWQKIKITQYPSLEKSFIHYFSALGEKIATLTFKHPSNAYLGVIEVEGQCARVILDKMYASSSAYDSKLLDIEGVFPNVWSWVLQNSEWMERAKGAYGIIATIQTENEPSSQSYTWIPDPERWGAYTRRRERFERYFAEAERALELEDEDGEEDTSLNRWERW